MRINFNPVFNYKNNLRNKRSASSKLKPLNVDTFSFQRAKSPFYAIKFDGEVTKYSDLSTAQQETGCPKNTMCDVMSGRKKILDGFVFVRASQLETIDENGEQVLDKTKVNKARERFLLSEKNYPIVLISQDCKTEIYETVKEACNDTRLPSSSFFRALKNPKYGVGSRAIAKLNDVVLRDEKGNVVFDENNSFVLDDEKLAKFYSAYFNKGVKIDNISFSGNARKIYAFDYEGNCFQFDSRPQASEALGMSRSRVTDSIRKKEVTHGYVFTMADDIEKIGEDGKRVLDLDKVQALFEIFNKAYNMPICVIDLNGKINRYLNYAEAEQKANIPQWRISDVIYRDNRFYESKGILIVRENEILLRDELGKIQKDSNGNYLYDLDKVANLMEGFMSGKIKPVIARNIKTGEVFTFKSATEASRYFSIPKQTLDDYLKSDNRIYKDYRFEYYDRAKINEFLGL